MKDVKLTCEERDADILVIGEGDSGRGFLEVTEHVGGVPRPSAVILSRASLYRLAEAALKVARKLSAAE